MNWTAEQIIALAPDANSAKSGRELASVTKWQTCGANDQVVWGECQGSGKNPYQTSIDLTEPAFKCSCPSRKFPCKHGLGLFLLWATQHNTFSAIPAPSWVDEWLAKRAQNKERKAVAEGAPAVVDTDPAKLAQRHKARAKRASEREAKVAAGLHELELWLRDMVRQGLATVPTRDLRYWENMAKRLVDAQAPGAARLVRDMSSIPAQGPGWTERLLEKLGLLFLLMESYKRLDTLPSGVQADVRAALGWTVKEDDLHDAETVRDVWLVLGQHSYEEERLRVQKTWLRGQQTQRHALILDFAYHNQPLDVSLLAGSAVDAEVAFYPSHWPLRSVVTQRFAATPHAPATAGFHDFAAMLEAYATALSHNAWLESFPAACSAVLPVQRDDLWFLRDAADALLPLRARFAGAWKMLAVSGGHPLQVFGEWDGHTFLPLSVWADGAFVKLG